ncbi:MAG: hypothetical protein ACOYOO_12390, partial [Saprospiraceae bacterium]
KKLEALKTDTDRVVYLLKIVEDQHQSNPGVSLEYAAKALAFARQSGSTPHLLDALSAASKSYFYAGYSGEAAAYVKEFAELAERYGTNHNKAVALNDLAALKATFEYNTYNAEIKELYESALALFQKAASEDSTLANDPAYQKKIVAVYVNIAIQLKLKGDLNESESYLLKALNLAEKTPVNTPTDVRVIANYMDLLRLQGREKDMLRQYDRGMQLVKQFGFQTMSALFDYPLAEWYESRQNIGQAIVYYEKVYSLGKSLENHSYIRTSATKLSRLYEQINDQEAALRFSRIADNSAQIEKKAEVLLRLKEAELKSQFLAWEAEVLQKNKRWIKRVWKIAGVVSLIAFIGLFLSFQQRRKYRITALKNLELELTAQNLQLENQLLESQLEAKNKALAAEVMRKIQRNDLIKTKVAQLLEQSRQVKPEARNFLRSAAETLGETLEEDSWKAFDMRFKEVDQRFYENLANICPSLTVGERRICAFLRLDMSSKEISAMTGQSVRAVELMRTRIRKKLGITNAEASLSQFLVQL